MGGEAMVGFGHKQAWLAIRGGDRMAVTAALALRDLGPVSWRNGIDLAYLTDDRVVLTPPLPGAREVDWLLVAGRWLLRAESMVDVVERAATIETEVQLFATHRLLELHRWERAVDGVAVREFEYVGESGEVTRWRGDPDDAERAVGLPDSLGWDHDVLVGEADVMRIAGAWSIDPTTLDGTPASGPLRAAAPL
jgi:hypothetical protein